MSIKRILLMGATIVALLVIALLVVLRADPAWAAIEPATGAPPSAAPAIIAPDRPVSSDELSTSGGLAVCVDRGEGSTYTEGDRITVCASANIPTIAIYPPPTTASICFALRAASASQSVQPIAALLHGSGDSTHYQYGAPNARADLTPKPRWR
jgi:hypothetical protein